MQVQALAATDGIDYHAAKVDWTFFFLYVFGFLNFLLIFLTLLTTEVAAADSNSVECTTSYLQCIVEKVNGEHIFLVSSVGITSASSGIMVLD